MSYTRTEQKSRVDELLKKQGDGNEAAERREKSHGYLATLPEETNKIQVDERRKQNHKHMKFVSEKENKNQATEGTTVTRNAWCLYEKQKKRSKLLKDAMVTAND